MIDSTKQLRGCLKSTRSWTNSEIAYLHALDKTRVDLAAVSARLARTPSAVKHKLYRLGYKSQSSPLTGAAAKFRAWTPEEEAALPNLVTALGLKKAAEKLGRSLGAVRVRASLKGITAPLERTWTEKESNTLRLRWGELSSLEELEREFQRSRKAIRRQASIVLKLPLLPVGYAALSSVAERCGLSRAAFRRVLGLHRVKTHNLHELRGYEKKRGHIRIVEVTAAEDAVAKWCASEQLNVAADRHNLTHHKLREALASIGVKRPKQIASGRQWRIPSNIVDRAVAEWRSSKESRP